MFNTARCRACSSTATPSSSATSRSSRATSSSWPARHVKKTSPTTLRTRPIPPSPVSSTCPSMPPRCGGAQNVGVTPASSVCLDLVVSARVFYVCVTDQRRSFVWRVALRVPCRDRPCAHAHDHVLMPCARAHDHRNGPACPLPPGANITDHRIARLALVVGTEDSESLRHSLCY